MKQSIIVPLYQGHKYISNLIKMIETCAGYLNDNYTIELILSNDDSEEKIEEKYFSDKVDIIVINTDLNRGIHGARVRGLAHCTGDYIMFLDQDDWISENYLASQITRLKNSKADAVVCRARENGREIYNVTYPFEKTIDYLNMVSKGNMIVSPGQVLMLKEAIPEIWKHQILKSNGVDDWFLWICMMQQGCRFALNDEILFEHRVEGSNLSWNSEKMLSSEREMLKIIKSSGLWDATMIAKLEGVIESEQQRYIDFLEKYRTMFFIYDKWMSLESRKKCLSAYLYKQKVRKVAVYGMGYIGKQLVDRLKGTEVLVCGSIDRNAAFIDAGIPIVRFEEFDEKPELIIVTVLENTKKIVQDIEERIKVSVVTIQQLLESWEEEGQIRHGSNEHCIDDR